LKAKTGIFYILVFIFFLQTVLVSAAAAVTRIMPLGNSITVGTCCGKPPEEMVAYRQKLYLDLIDEGYDVDFVGGEQAGGIAVPAFDIDHEGHGGKRAYYIRDNIYLNGSNFLGNNPADVILLHIGTNDITIDQPTNQIVNEVEEILEEIEEFEFDIGKDVPILLAIIILRTDGRNPQTIAFNNELRTMAETRIAGGDNITIVDMQNALSYPGDMDDNVHPNMTGYNKMADVWYSALEQILPDPCPDADFTASPTNGYAP